jgi:hypothetical protein
MPHSDNYDLLDYLKVCYQNHREEHIKNTLEYDCKNRTKILIQRKLKYNNSKKVNVLKTKELLSLFLLLFGWKVGGRVEAKNQTFPRK